jgi:hypothetical protein
LTNGCQPSVATFRQLSIDQSFSSILAGIYRSAILLGFAGPARFCWNLQVLQALILLAFAGPEDFVNVSVSRLTKNITKIA